MQGSCIRLTRGWSEGSTTITVRFLSGSLTRLGAQGAVCSGGRYDGLVEKLGGRSTPAVGWAMGMERFVALFEACGGTAPSGDAHVYVVAVGDAALRRAVVLAEELRSELDGVLRVELNLGGGSFKSQLKRADKSNATLALILGEQELAEGKIGLKPLRSTEDQCSVPMEKAVAEVATRLDNE